MKKFLHLICIFYLLLPGVLYAQNKTVSGTVRDETGPLLGATIIEKGNPTNGVSANEEGAYSLTLKGTSNTLVFTMVGYQTQEVQLDGKTTVNVTLSMDATGLKEVVVVGYGTQTKITSTGAVSTVSGQEIRDVPSPNIQNTLAGRVPGFFSMQRSGQPGASAAEFTIRGINSLNGGNQPLIIVDDVEYSYDQVQQLDANEVESISILKDASTTAIYGIRGANGVLVITTKRGRTGKPRINFTTEAGVQTPVIKPEFLDSYQTALLRNEALRNDGLPEQWSAEDLELFRNGHDPYGHPNVDWYDVIFKKYSFQTRNNFDISGGTERVKYFISLGHLFQDGLVKDFTTKRSEVNNNYYYERYNFRSNLDIEATKNLSLRLDISGRLGEVNEPRAPGNVIAEVYTYQRLPPFAYPVVNPNGTYPWSPNVRFTNPSVIGELANRGYERTYNTDLNTVFSATQKLDFITTGLSATGRIAYSSRLGYARRLHRNKIPAFYYNPETETYTVHSNGDYRLERFTLEDVAGSRYSYSTVNTQLMLRYDRNFGDHRVYSLALVNQNSNITNSAIPVRFRGITARIGYDYKQKYLVEINGAYNGTSSFLGDKKYGLFPAISAGWNIAEEPFVEDNVPFLDMFKIRASYGLVGSDQIGGGYGYEYKQVYTNAGSYSFGENHNGFTGIREGTLGNTDISWEKERKTNVGVDIHMFKSKLSLTVDYFNNFRYDQLITRGAVLDVLGVGLPPVNMGETRNKGFEALLTYQNNIGELNYRFSGNITVARNVVEYRDESQPRYPWLALTGKPLGQGFGYTWIGFYENEEDIANSAKPEGIAVSPGDLKYEDKNNDGTINEFDRTAIGKPNHPQTIGGFSFGLSYKGFDFNVLFQGATDYSYRLVAEGIEPFVSNLQPIHQERWTPGKTNAKFPRLSTVFTGISSPTTYSSDFWLLDAYYLRMKSVDIGYRLPAHWINPIKLNSARIYLSGYNLLTWDNYDLYQVDPEIVSGGTGRYYPNSMIVNLGVQIGF